MAILFILKNGGKNLYYLGDASEDQVAKIKTIATRISSDSIDSISRTFVNVVHEEIQVDLKPCTEVSIIRMQK